MAPESEPHPTKSQSANKTTIALRYPHSTFAFDPKKRPLEEARIKCQHPPRLIPLQDKEREPIALYQPTPAGLLEDNCLKLDLMHNLLH
jgi:hypothetical protein